MLAKNLLSKENSIHSPYNTGVSVGLETNPLTISWVRILISKIVRLWVESGAIKSINYPTERE